MNEKNSICIGTENDFDFDREENLRKFVGYYLEEIDAKLAGKKLDKRDISPFVDLKDYISIAFDTYFVPTEYGEGKKNFQGFVLMLLEMILYQVVLGQTIISEETRSTMDNLIKVQLGKDFNFESNKHLSQLAADIIKSENDEYSKIFKQINEKFGNIIFNINQLFANYYLMIFDVNDNLILNELSLCEEYLLNFFINNNKYLNIPIEFMTTKESLYGFLTKEPQDSEKNISESDSQGTQETEKRPNIKIEHFLDLNLDNNKKNDIIELKPENNIQINNNNNKSNHRESKEEELRIIKEDIQKLNNKLFNVIEDNSRLKTDNIKLNGELSKVIGELSKTNGELSQMKAINIKQQKLNLNLTLLFQNTNSQLLAIQSRDLWKAIVNYNCFQLNIERKGYYDKRIDNIISQMDNDSNSKIYKKFLANIKDFIDNGDKEAHKFYKKYPIGMETKYLELLIKNQKLNNLTTKEIKFVKKVLEKIKTEEMLKRFMEGGKVIEDNQTVYDIKQILKNTDEN